MSRPGVKDLAIRDVRDGALLVEYPERSEEEANRAAVALGVRLRARGGRGVLDAVPAARSLLVLFDPSRVSRRGLAGQIERIGARAGADVLRRLFRIPVAYGGSDGPDLAELAGRLGIPGEEFARRHAAAEYRVAFVGFAPGFPYLVGLAVELAAPRLASPRPRVPAGSVAIGGPYSGIYPSATPGGWRLIGRSGVALFDPAGSPPALLAAGDRVRFEPVASGQVREPTARREPPRPAGRATLRVIAPGTFTSIQAAPRHGSGSSGIPAGGAMDTRALARANALVGNSAGAAALEIALTGPELEGLEEATVAIAGADLEAARNGRLVSADEAFRLEAGDRLRFGRAVRGARAYLAVRGGLEGCALTRRLETGDEIALDSRPSAVGVGPARAVELSAEIVLRVILGPQADWFAAAETDRFLGADWRVSAVSDRRGLRLEGPRLSHVRSPEIPPEGALFGSIQVPGGGSPIVLGPDGPVTGGYPKIATVIGPDLPLLGQAAPGALLRFAAVTLAEALEARREYH